MSWRRFALALLRCLRRQLRPAEPPVGELRHYVGDNGCYWRELTEAERAEMRETDPRPARAPRRWVEPRAPRWRW